MSRVTLLWQMHRREFLVHGIRWKVHVFPDNVRDTKGRWGLTPYHFDKHFIGETAYALRVRRCTLPLGAMVTSSLLRDYSMQNHTGDLEQILSEIKGDPRYKENVQYGKSRKGHREGTVAAHIQELEQNLENVDAFLRAAGQPLAPIEKVKLEILIHVHDTFKAQAAPRVRISDERSHASLARAFLSEWISDPVLLAMVQFHDAPWSLFQQQKKFGNYNADRLNELRVAIPDQQLFQLFQIIDNTTSSKIPVGDNESPVKWFIRQAAPFTDSKLDLLAVADHLKVHHSRT